MFLFLNTLSTYDEKDYNYNFLAVLTKPFFLMLKNQSDKL